MPLYDIDYDMALLQWVEAVQRWERGDDPERKAAAEEGIRYYWDWEGPPPSPECYRQAHEHETCCYQVYETVSEGTPISPVFDDELSLIQWLIEQGDSEDLAREFVRRGGCAESFSILENGKLQDERTLYDN